MGTQAVIAVNAVELQLFPSPARSSYFKQHASMLHMTFVMQ